MLVVVMINIIPINDSKEHTEDSTCECCPMIVEEGSEIIIVHNSFDGREAIEWAEEILKD